MVICGTPTAFVEVAVVEPTTKFAEEEVNALVPVPLTVRLPARVVPVLVSVSPAVEELTPERYFSVMVSPVRSAQ